MTVRISAPNFSCTRRTTGSSAARLRAFPAAAPLVARGGAACAAPPPSIFIFMARPLVADAAASSTLRALAFSAASTMAADATFIKS